MEVNPSAENLGLQPLPDIDFNIRPGNTLVGFATYEDVKKAVEGESQGKLDLFGDMQRISEKAEIADRAFQKFREMQIVYDMKAEDFRQAKKELRDRLDDLNNELDKYLAEIYELGLSKKDEKFHKWQKSHTPFHWFVEFYKILQSGGFDVIIGNPPYVEQKDVKDYKIIDFETLSCGDLYACVTEQSYKIANYSRYIGLIVPISIFGVDGFKDLQRVTLSSLHDLWVSHFANRPSQLFDGAQKRLTILIGKKTPRNKTSEIAEIYTTGYKRWIKQERGVLFPANLKYAHADCRFQVFSASLEKLGSEIEKGIFRKMLLTKETLGSSLVSSSSKKVFYTRKFGYFLAFLDFVPRVICNTIGITKQPSELKSLSFRNLESVMIVVSALSSSLFFWFWHTLSDCRNLNKRDLLAFPMNPEGLDAAQRHILAELGKEYLTELRKTSRMMTKSGLNIETFDYASCKPIIDRVDQALARHYGFTDEELDFIINYDIKYRIGLDSLEDSCEA